MRELLAQLIESVMAGVPVAYCRLVETRGSTPQKAGAAMLVFPHGGQAGTLGGGCVEAEVKRHAQATLVSGKPAIYLFQLDHDYGWDDGLICGGRMQIVVQPIRYPSQLAYFQTLQRTMLAGQGATEVIVFRPTRELPATELPATELPATESPVAESLAEPATPGPTTSRLVPARGPINDAEPAACETDGGSRSGRSSSPEVVGSTPDSFVPQLLLFDEAGELLVSLNDPSAALISAAAAELAPLKERPRPYARRALAYLPLLSRPRLLIVGGGHVGKAVADLASELDFEIWIVDDRPDYVTQERFPHVARRAAGGLRELLLGLEITADTYCLIVTRGHQHDEEALECLANRGARYVGMIGSRRKIRLIFDDLCSPDIQLHS